MRPPIRGMPVGEVASSPNTQAIALRIKLTRRLAAALTSRIYVSVMTLAGADISHALHSRMTALKEGRQREVADQQSK